jgi:hypothetical protein
VRRRTGRRARAGIWAHGGSSIRLGYRSEAVVAGCVGPFNRHILVKPLVDHG